MLDRFKAAATAAANKVSEGTAAITEMGLEKFKSAIQEISASSEPLREVGLTIQKMELRVGLSPSLMLVVERSADVNMSKLAAYQEANPEAKYLQALVATLVTADRVAQSVRPVGQRLAEYMIELSVPPAVTLVYMPQLTVLPVVLSEAEAMNSTLSGAPSDQVILAPVVDPR